MFVDGNNNVYVAETSSNRVQVWAAGSSTPTRTISAGLNARHALCATGSGNLFIDNGYNGNVQMWTPSATAGFSVMTVPGRCMGLYVDTNNTLYCALDCSQEVLGRSLASNSTPTAVVADTGNAGSGATQFLYPNEVVLHLNFTLYVAGWGNNRV